jgi:hypothetical protein
MGHRDDRLAHRRAGSLEEDRHEEMAASSASQGIAVPEVPEALDLRGGRSVAVAVDLGAGAQQQGRLTRLCRIAREEQDLLAESAD